MPASPKPKKNVTVRVRKISASDVSENDFSDESSDITASSGSIRFEVNTSRITSSPRNNSNISVTDSEHSSRLYPSLPDLSESSALYPSLSPVNDPRKRSLLVSNLKREPIHSSDKKDGLRSSPPIVRDSPSKVVSPRSSTSNHLVCIAAISGVILICVSVCIHMWGSSAPEAISNSDSSLQKFINYFHDVKESFEKQTPGFWRVLRAGTKPIIEQNDPREPAVFIIVIPSDAVATAHCLIKQFADMITSLFRASPPIEFIPKRVDVTSPEVIKHQLDDTLDGGFSNGSRVAVIHHLEQLPGESAMMLHSYCDNDNAPYRRAVYLLTLYVDETSSAVTESDAFVEGRLQVLWGEELKSNRLPPLLSRIANSIAFVRPENGDVLKQNRCSSV